MDTSDCGGLEHEVTGSEWPDVPVRVMPCLRSHVSKDDGVTRRDGVSGPSPENDQAGPARPAGPVAPGFRRTSSFGSRAGETSRRWCKSVFF